MNMQRWLEALRQGAVDPDHAARYHGGGKGAPPAPDYAGAAAQQGAASQAAQTSATYANRPTVNTPFGSQTWGTGTMVDPATGQTVTTWEQNLNLSPAQQAALNAQQNITRGRSQAAQTLLGQATGAFGTPFNWDDLPDTPGSVSEAQKNAYATMSAALEPGRTQQRAGLDTKLANMGLGMDSEAARRAQFQLGEQFAQQDKGLLAQALGEGRQDIASQQALRTAGIAEEAQRRGMPLNELNALLTGQQVSMPQMPSFQAAGAATPANLLGAATQQGQYQLGGMNQGIDWGSLAGTAAIGAGMAGMF
jgi:hypothetical protein